MRVYISGPINSPVKDLTPEKCRENFYKAAKAVAEKWPDAEVVNPLEVPVQCMEPGGVNEDGECGGPFDGHYYACWMRGDLKALLDCDSILLLPGWSQSRGATREHAIAEDMGLRPYYMVGGVIF